MSHHDLTDLHTAVGVTFLKYRVILEEFENQIKLLGMACGERPNVLSIQQIHECPLKVWHVIGAGHSTQDPVPFSL